VTKKYDDAEFHFLNFTNEETKNETGGTHIGMFLAWALLRGLGGEELAPLRKEIELRQRTPGQLIFDLCDGKLTEYDLSPRGKAFADDYYEQLYYSDYWDDIFESQIPNTGHQLDDSCSVPDTWENYELISVRLDHRWRLWLGNQGMAETPPSRQQVLDAALSAMAPLLATEGFTPDPASDAEMFDEDTTAVRRLFVASFPGGEQWLAIIARDLEGGGCALVVLAVSRLLTL
jgi:hypothetical protein